MIDLRTLARTETTRHASKRRLVAAAWAGYLSLAPVAWLPGVPHDAFVAGKTFMFLVAVVFTWVYARERAVPRGLAGPVGLALVAATSIFAVVQASGFSTAMRATIEIVLAFGIMWTMYVFQREIASVWSVAGAAAVVQGLLSLVIIAAFLGWVDVQAPDVFNSADIVDIGLSGRHTGWSNAVALFIPFALALVMRPGTLVIRLIAAGAAAATLLGQLISGGRTGVFVSLLAVILMVVFVYGLPGIVLALAIGYGSFYLYVSGFASRLGIDRFDVSLGDIDSLSNRADLLRFGTERFNERPIVGHGYGKPVVDIPFLDSVEIHNVWLRLAAEGGIFLVLSFAAVVFSILGKAVDVLWRATNSGSRAQVVETSALLTCLLSGIVISFVEPNIFFGTMHASAIWWVAAGGVVARYFAVQRTRLTLEERISRIHEEPRTIA